MKRTLMAALAVAIVAGVAKPVWAQLDESGSLGTTPGGGGFGSAGMGSAPSASGSGLGSSGFGSGPAATTFGSGSAPLPGGDIGAGGSSLTSGDAFGLGDSAGGMTAPGARTPTNVGSAPSAPSTPPTPVPGVVTPSNPSGSFDVSPAPSAP